MNYRKELENIYNQTEWAINLKLWRVFTTTEWMERLLIDDYAPSDVCCLLKERDMYKTANYLRGKTNDELLEQLAEANEDAERLYGVVNNEISDPEAYVNIVRAKHRARIQQDGEG